MIIIFLVTKIYMKKDYIRLVPAKFNVSDVLFSKEEIGGFGPGGNEQGLIIYKLPDDVASKITSQGINFFDNISIAKHSNIQSDSYEKWDKTPIIDDSNWLDNDSNLEAKPNKASVKNFFANGGPIEIELKIEEEVNSIIMEEDNFYSRGRIGTLIVAPAKRKIIYIYNS